MHRPLAKNRRRSFSTALRRGIIRIIQTANLKLHIFCISNAKIEIRRIFFVIQRWNSGIPTIIQYTRYKTGWGKSKRTPRTSERVKFQRKKVGVQILLRKTHNYT